MHHHVEAEFECAPESVKAAREFVKSSITKWGLGGPGDAVVLLTSELATNAVVHARTPYHIDVDYRFPTLVVRVRDGSRHRPARRSRGPSTRHQRDGRGLVIVEELADAWGSEACESGKEVWFTVDVQRQPHDARHRHAVGAALGR